MLLVRLGLLFCALGAACARAQCDPRWIQDPSLSYAGINGTGYASTVWDPDGNGPGAALLVVGGEFTTAFDAASSHIVAWDGVRWRALGSGVNGTVWSLGVYRGRLIVGGTFSLAGDVPAHAVAAWDGAGWAALGDGFQYAPHTFAEFQGELIAGGGFTYSGAQPLNRIARWDGAAWRPLGAGVAGVAPVSVDAMCIYQGTLVVGGRFDQAGVSPAHCVAAWDGSVWSPLGAGVSDQVNALLAFNGELVAGGVFSSAGGSTARCVAAWNGAAWRPLSTGFQGPDSIPWVRALSEYRGTLYASGRFERTIIGGRNVATSRIAAWDGSNWRPCGAGLGPQGVAGPTAYALAEYQDRLVICGANIQTAGDRRVSDIASWDGAAWNPLSDIGTDEAVQAILPASGGAWIGGKFTQIGGSAAAHLAFWNGLSFSPVGSGLDAPVYAMNHWRGGLYVAGAFTHAGAVTAAGIARWDGAVFSPLGAGLDGTVYSSAIFNDELYVGGAFGRAGGLTATRIARWDGAVWRPVGSGIAGQVVYAMLPSPEGLYVGGAFSAAGGQTALNISRWNGSTWSPVGAGPSMNPVYALVRHGGDLYAGGNISEQIYPGVKRWNGAAWSVVGQHSVGSQTSVFALESTEEGLYATGDCPGALGETSRFLARWDGAVWNAVGARPNDGGRSFGLVGGELLVGGRFDQIGSDVSAFLARWSRTGAPWLAVQPGDVVCPVGSTTRLITQAAQGYDAPDLQYRWRIEEPPDTGIWTDLADGDLVLEGVTTARLSGSSTASVEVLGISASRPFRLACRISNDCGDAVSDPASVVVRCPADFNADGFLDFFDYLDFVSCFEGQGCSSPDPLAADFNADGFVDFFDYGDFVDAFAAGC